MHYVYMGVYVYAYTVRCLVAQSCPTLCNQLHYSPLGSSVHVISQARIPEWTANFFSTGSSQPKDQTHISCFLHCRWILYLPSHWRSPRYMCVHIYTYTQFTAKFSNIRDYRYFLSLKIFPFTPLFRKYLCSQGAKTGFISVTVWV